MEFGTVHDRWSQQDINRYYAEGQWDHATFFDHAARQAATQPDKVFATDGTSSLTYGELHESALRLAAGFLGLGIGRGDRVAVQLPSWVEFMQTVMALSRLGAITVPIMPIYRRDDVMYVLENAGVRTVVTCGTFHRFDHAAMFVGLRDDVPGLRDVVVVRGPAQATAGTIPFSSVLAEGEVDEAALGEAAGPDDPFTIVFSSGTTARPKGCLHTVNTFGCGARGLGRAFGYTSDDIQLNPSPITHTTGFVTGFLLPLMHGASVHLMEAWDPAQGLEDIAKYHTTCTVTATTFLQTLMDAYDPDRHDPSSMRLWVAAGAPIPAAFIERANRVLPQLQVLSLYGRTENVTTTTCTATDDPVKSVTSDGHVFPGSEVRVVDALGEEVPQGEEGDIAYRGPMHMIEYIHNPEETEALFTPDGFSRSGDLGTMDADGYVRVTGRLKDIVIRGGLNISVRQIEDLLTAHPAVRATAAVAMPDARLGEKVCLFLVPIPGQNVPTLPDISAFLLERGLAVQKVPERLEVVEALPTTATGKIQKHVLRTTIAQLLAAERG